MPDPVGPEDGIRRLRRGIRGPKVAAAFQAGPELIGLPSFSGTWISKIHQRAATLAAHLKVGITHWPDSSTEPSGCAAGHVPSWMGAWTMVAHGQWSTFRGFYPSHGPSSLPQALPPSFSQDSTSPSGAVSVTAFSAPHCGHLNRRRGSAGWTCSVLRARLSSRPTSSMRCPHLSHGLSMAISASLWLPRRRSLPLTHRGAVIPEPSSSDRRCPLVRLTVPARGRTASSRTGTAISGRGPPHRA